MRGPLAFVIAIQTELVALGGEFGGNLHHCTTIIVVTLLKGNQVRPQPLHLGTELVALGGEGGEFAFKARALFNEVVAIVFLRFEFAFGFHGAFQE